MFPAEYLSPPPADEIEVCLFGPGFGESIVMHLPGIGWGIIDSCTFSDSRQKKAIPMEYISSLYPEYPPTIEFLILSHPHKDHYDGMDQIIEQYKGGVNRVCWYMGDGIRELKDYICKQAIGRIKVFEGFPAVYKALNAAPNQRRLGEMTTILEENNLKLHGHSPFTCKVSALSPSAASIQKYINLLKKHLYRTGDRVTSVRDEDHNLLSVVILVQYGSIQIVLGSDLESGSSQEGTGWVGLMQNQDCPDLKANIVKAPHHGSTNAFYMPAWKAHSSQHSPFALLTPFVHGNVNLPHQKCLRDIGRYTTALGITSEVKLDPKTTKYFSREVSRAIGMKTRKFYRIQKSNNVGFLRIRMKANGTITERFALPPALWVKKHALNISNDQ